MTRKLAALAAALVAVLALGLTHAQAAEAASASAPGVKSSASCSGVSVSANFRRGGWLWLTVDDRSYFTTFSESARLFAAIPNDGEAHAFEWLSFNNRTERIRQGFDTLTCGTATA